ncbi:hypothetical protein [Leptospira stimsonii]|uniref:Uncharacterized protein n=1 Tax=Leptospira stimsonii TaxID=2202203 RepID=A0A396Z6A0_9LEPT|nr:hypothetical protein [Leptospira stimsonii]RHX89224.1 hypothetical protein DLM75_15380 [Leptospira stimsonii]
MQEPIPDRVIRFCFVFFVFIRIQNAEEAACPNIDPYKRVLSLEFSVRSERTAILLSKLRIDGIRIHGKETGSKESVKLFVKIKEIDFEEFFSGRVDYIRSSLTVLVPDLIVSLI